MKSINFIVLFSFFISIFSMDLSSLSRSQVGNLAMVMSLALVAYYTIKYKNEIKVNIYLINIPIILIVISLSSLIVNQNTELIYILRVVKLNFFVFFVLVGIFLTKANKNNLHNAFLASYGVFCGIIFFQNLSQLTNFFQFVRVLEMNFLFLKLETGNLFACTLVFILSIIIFNKNYYNNGLVKIMFWPVVIISIIITLLTFSRTSYILLLILLFYIIYGKVKNYHKSFHLILATVSISCIVFLLLYLKETVIGMRFLYTFQEGSLGGSIDNSSYSRILILQQIILDSASSIKKIIFGNGFEDFDNRVIYKIGLPFTSPHNGFLNVLDKVGYIYLTIIMLLMLLPLIYFYKRSKLYYDFLILTIMLLITNFTTDGINYLMLSQIYFLFYGSYIYCFLRERENY